MSVSLHNTVQLAWAIANAEACVAGSPVIQPTHLLLGVLKIMDPEVASGLAGQGFSGPAIAEFGAVVRQTRQYLEMTDPEITALRRALRKAIRPAGTGTYLRDIVMLHRAPATRALFDQAAALAFTAQAHEVTAFHLLQELQKAGWLDSDRWPPCGGAEAKPAALQLAEPTVVSSAGRRWSMVGEPAAGEVAHAPAAPAADGAERLHRLVVTLAAQVARTQNVEFTADGLAALCTCLGRLTSELCRPDEVLDCLDYIAAWWKVRRLKPSVQGMAPQSADKSRSIGACDVLAALQDWE